MFLFGKKADIDIELSDCESRKVVEYDDTQYPVYYDGETVNGKVNINVRPGKKLDHQGIMIELVGKIEFLYDRGTSQEFLSLEKDLARPGVLINGQISYPFEFRNVRKPYETYRGSNVNLRYILRVHVIQRLNNIVREKEIEVETLSLYQEPGDGVKMEVGIEDSLHIEFEYSSIKYHLQDVIVGKIYFILVRVKIKHMDLQIIRHETVGRGPTIFAESTYLNKYELMDGSPVRGENIPVRVFLKDVAGLRPTMQDVANGLFSVRYFLNLVLTDEDDRRYYKQQEIFLYRRCEKKHGPIASRSQAVQHLLQQGRLKQFQIPDYGYQQQAVSDHATPIVIETSRYNEQSNQYDDYEDEENQSEGICDTQNGMVNSVKPEETNERQEEQEVEHNSYNATDVVDDNISAAQTITTNTDVVAASN